MDKKTGFVKRPTFSELAKLEKEVVHAKPIVRDATTYWNSYQAHWLKGPIDKVADQASLIRTRQSIKNLALNQSSGTDLPVGHIQGNMYRALSKPMRLASDTADFVHDGMAGNYANPASANDVLMS